jgi:hypothetical protein
MTGEPSTAGRHDKAAAAKAKEGAKGEAALARARADLGGGSRLLWVVSDRVPRKVHFLVEKSPR